MQEKITVELDKNKIIESAVTGMFDDGEELTPQMRYQSLVRHEKIEDKHYEIGDPITVWEKLDGSNVALKMENGILRGFSRNQELDEHNTLEGFYTWAKQLFDEGKLPLIPKHIYFGEWTCLKRIDYGQENFKQFFLFDIYSEYYNEYLDDTEVTEEAIHMNLKHAPILYKGEYQGREHLKSLIGKSALNPESFAEGIVIKNYDKRFKDGYQAFTKMVSENFSEVSTAKPYKEKVKSPETEFVQMFATEARIEKMLNKARHEGLLTDFSIENMGNIIRTVNPFVFEDIMKEERDLAPEGVQDKDILRAVNKTVPARMRKILQRWELEI